MSAQTLNVLIIDNNMHFVKTAQQNLKKFQTKTFNLIWKEDWAKGIEELEKNKAINIILMDYFLSGKNGAEVTKILKEKKISIPVIFLSSDKDLHSAIEAMKLGVEDYLIKEEVTETALPRAILNVLERVQLKKQIEESEKNKIIAEQRAAAVQELIIAICHEFNNPLAAMKISADIIAKHPLTEEEKKLVHEISHHIETVEKEIKKLQKLNSQT